MKYTLQERQTIFQILVIMPIYSHQINEDDWNPGVVCSGQCRQLQARYDTLILMILDLT